MKSTLKVAQTVRNLRKSIDSGELSVSQIATATVAINEAMKYFHNNRIWTIDVHDFAVFQDGRVVIEFCLNEIADCEGDKIRTLIVDYKTVYKVTGFGHEYVVDRIDYSTCRELIIDHIKRGRELPELK